MNNLQKGKIKYDNYDFEWNGEISPQDFLKANEGYYSQKWVEDNPLLAYKVNDGDLEDVYDDLSLEDVSDLMGEVYRENLFINYGF